MDLRTIKNYELWLKSPYFNKKICEELESIKENEKEIEDRFYKDLEFGTAGLRGIMGAGTNRMNIYTVKKVTQSLANYIKEQGQYAMNKGVVIAYDSRHMSEEFGKEAALVLAGNDIKAYLFDKLTPTPQLSFAVRHLEATAGVVITASHNPPEYNGYKVYWEDGAQLATELADDITKKINEIIDFNSIYIIDEEEAKLRGLLKYVGVEIEDLYIEAVKGQSLRNELVCRAGKDIKIVYTPLHGAGNIPVRRVLKEIGFNQVLVVPEQKLPDPNFYTIKYPNPEDRTAFDLAIDLGEREGADLILGTDPDCDRVGALVRNKENEFVLLTGNQVGALLVDYILSTMKEQNKLPSNGIIIKTIVTSELGATIAKKYGVDTISTLTGFKYIAGKIKEFESTKEKTFLFGYEESNGYLAGTYARDKDAVVASMLICEMATYYHVKGITLYDVLLSLYKEHGYFIEDLCSITLEGKEGLQKINAIMERFRHNPPNDIAGYPVIKIEDYLNQNNLPKANVLKFVLEGNRWIVLRASGTETKLKIYGGVMEESLEKGKESIESLLSSISYL